MTHLSLMMILTGIAVAAAAFGFAWFAIRRWRSQGRSIVDSLGLRWDHHSTIDLLVGLGIAGLVMLGIFACELWSGGISRKLMAAAAGMPRGKRAHSARGSRINPAQGRTTSSVAAAADVAAKARCSTAVCPDHRHVLRPLRLAS